ncbi:MAG: MTH938/NDUFAF3 family protein, partial [bacterium]
GKGDLRLIVEGATQVVPVVREGQEQKDRGYKERLMQFESFSFGSIQIDGITYEHDVVIDHGEVSKREKKPSKKFRAVFGHTPLSIEEQIPWNCRRLVIGTGTGALPVMDQVKREAQRRKVELVIVPTARAVELLKGQSPDTNAILHVTC